MKKRVNITLSKTDIAVVDLLSEKYDMSRSEFIAYLIHLEYGNQLNDEDAITSNDVFERVDRMI